MTARLTEFIVELINKNGKEETTSVMINPGYQTIKDAIDIILDVYGIDTEVTAIRKYRDIN